MLVCIILIALGSWYGGPKVIWANPIHWGYSSLQGISLAHDKAFLMVLVAQEAEETLQVPFSPFGFVQRYREKQLESPGAGERSGGTALGCSANFHNGGLAAHVAIPVLPQTACTSVSQIFWKAIPRLVSTPAGAGGGLYTCLAHQGNMQSRIKDKDLLRPARKLRAWMQRATAVLVLPLWQSCMDLAWGCWSPSQLLHQQYPVSEDDHREIACVRLLAAENPYSRHCTGVLLGETDGFDHAKKQMSKDKAGPNFCSSANHFI